MILLIDTTEIGKLLLSLYNNEHKLAFRKLHLTDKISEALLPELQRLLVRANRSIQDISLIKVNPGPGGFSATRSGVAVANALAFALNVPVAEWPSGKIKKMVLPKYDRAPNITKSKTF